MRRIIHKILGSQYRFDEVRRFERNIEDGEQRHNGDDESQGPALSSEEEEEAEVGGLPASQKD
jgi:hypothetical protein